MVEKYHSMTEDSSSNENPSSVSWGSHGSYSVCSVRHVSGRNKKRNGENVDAAILFSPGIGQ